ncbi:MAG: PepSY domain-containing protein [Kangiellaceae bacterium]|nr:PepSY domain-containing protein [Kangiellaceae bacterium]
MKRSLSAHSWIGLMLGAFMYLICLSGTIAVFYEEIERWEQPVAEEYLSYDKSIVEQSFNAYIKTKKHNESSEHLYIVFPNEVIPRLKFADDMSGWYVNADGKMGRESIDDWTELLKGLHNNLHLPISFGYLFVSAIGALFCGLIFSGFLSHPSIFKDAFKWRTKSSQRINQTDIHNRLSVWGAPFHLMIAITGTFYGFILLFMIVFSQSIDDLDQQQVMDQVYPAEPKLENQTGEIKVAIALTEIEQLTPDGQLLFMIIHDANTEQRFMEFFVQQPGRLIYSENYRFDIAGNYLGKSGFSDGHIAKQIAYSVYRIHFGHFAGYATKIIYFVLGLALTVISVSGINIWLAKRKYKDKINLLWSAFVWGTPIALSVSAITQVIFHIESINIFWGLVVGCSLAGLKQQNEIIIRRNYQLLTAVSLFVLLAGFSIKYGEFSLNNSSLTISIPLLICAAYFLYKGLTRKILSTQGQQESQEKIT